MPNGATVALPPDLQPIQAPAKADARLAELEQRIGMVVADAALAVCVGRSEWENGGLAPATKTAAGDLFVESFKLQETTLGELDFDVVAHREGLRNLRMRYGAVLAEHYGDFPASALDRTLNQILSWPLSVLARVTAVERALAH
jgi:hypothetical protein